MVPDECVLPLDRRLIPEENVEEAEKYLMQTLSSVEGVRWQIEHVARIPTVPPLEAPLVDQLSEVIRKVTGESGKSGKMGLGDFGPVATLEWKAKHFGCGVVRPDCNIHGKDEFFYVEDVENLALIISRFISAP